MQVKCWLGFKQVGRTDVHQLTFPSRRLVAALLVPLGLALSAWEVGPTDRSSTSISSARWKRQKLATGSCGTSTEGWKRMSCRSVTNSSIRFRDYDLLRDLSRTDLAISLPRSNSARRRAI